MKYVEVTAFVCHVSNGRCLQVIVRSQSVQTVQEERHWVRVTAPHFDSKDIRFYLGCNSCGARCNHPEFAVYNCPSCKKNSVVSAYRYSLLVINYNLAKQSFPYYFDDYAS